MRQVSVMMKRIGTAALLLTTVLSYAIPVGAADSETPFKAIAPHIDPQAEKKPHKPLQAGLQMNHHVETPKRKVLRAQTDDSGGALKAGVRDGALGGKLRGGARSAQVDTLKGGNKANALEAAATSGVGIIGVKFVLTPGKPPVINRVFPGTPAYSLGLQKDDAIVAVDGVPTYGLLKEEVYDLIIGSPGTKVNVSIMRAGDFHVYTCTRMDINDLTDPVVRRDYLMSM